MKNKVVLFCLVALLLTLEVQAQEMAGLDKSPMDMAYYPDNFAHDRKFAPKLIGDTPALVRIKATSNFEIVKTMPGKGITAFGKSDDLMLLVRLMYKLFFSTIPHVPENRLAGTIIMLPYKFFIILFFTESTENEGLPSLNSL